MTKERKENDNYPTKRPLALRICQHISKSVTPKTILEPSCGAGSFLHAAREVWPDVPLRGLEIDRELVKQARADGFKVACCDALTADLEALGTFDLIVGNPPYSLAEKFVHHFRKMLSHDGQLVFLLRLNFMGGQKRYASLWTQWAPNTVLVLPKRPGFIVGESGTDMTEYGVYCWNKLHLQKGETTRLRWLDNRDID